MMSDSLSFKLIWAGAVLLLYAGCTNSQNDPDVDRGVDKPLTLHVEHFGPMRQVMREGRTQARVPIVEVVSRPHAFAVGALAGLAGEVTIIDGDVWVSRVAPDGQLVVTGPGPVEGDAATLLTIAHVSQWHGIKIESAVTGTELESMIERIARSMQLNTNEPFPFKIEGKLKQLDLHVINGYCPIATDSKTQERKPWRSPNFETADVTIVGFYAPNAVAVMTHHGTTIHAHAIGTADDKQFMGHIENVTVEPGMMLYVPKLK